MMRRRRIRCRANLWITCLSLKKVTSRYKCLPNGIRGEMKDKSDSGSQSVSAPTTEIEQVGVVTASKIYCGWSTEGLEHVLQPVQSDSTKASPPSANEPGSDSVAQKTIPKMGSSDPQDSSLHVQVSCQKPPNYLLSGSQEPRQENKATYNGGECALPSSRETSIQKSEALKEQSPSRLNAAETEIQPKSCATPKAPETTAVCETEKALEPTKLNEPEKTASSASTSRSKDSKSTTGKTPTFQEVQHIPIQSNASLRDAGGVSRTGLQTPRRKQSIVSFGAGIKEAPKALAHLEDMTPQPLPRKNLATILKASRSTTLPRVEPSVDFGDTHFTMIRFLRIAERASFPQRPLSTSSRLSRMSTGSVSSLVDSEVHSSGRPAITLRRVTRCRSSGLEDTILRGAHVQPSVFGSRPAGSFASLRRKKQLSSDRADVHNAFLLGPSLVTMLGNICSFHTGGNKSALKIVYGADPEPLSPENLSVMKAARERSAARGKQREAQCAYATYLVILGLSYTPALIWDLEPRVVLRKERAEDSRPPYHLRARKQPTAPQERPAGLPGAFVYGDGNARRLKRAVLQASAWHRGVHCRTKKDATLVETMEAIETAMDVWDSTETIVVLLAGLNDIQDDTSPHDSTEKFKSQITSWKARAKGHLFVVYGVPEVGPKDDTMRRKCELWNSKPTSNLLRH
ncbi:hypothetical protein MRX96_023592 [Rhipicephalus microplus]